MQFFKIIPTFLLLYVTVLACTSNAQTLDIKGDWKINLSHSSLPQALSPAIVPSELKIETGQGWILIERAVLSPDSTLLKSSEKLNFNGDSTITTVSGSRKKVATISWSVDKKSIVETANYSWTEKDTKKQSHSKDEFSLSADGKILTLRREMISDYLNYRAIAVYDKQ